MKRELKQIVSIIRMQLTLQSNIQISNKLNITSILNRTINKVSKIDTNTEV